MIPIDQMTLGELAAHIDSHLQKRGINVVLSGGASVAIYTDNAYVSNDLDFIAVFELNPKKVNSSMRELGFERSGKYYRHPQSDYFVEFISGPPSVGRDPIEEIREISLATGKIRVISPTDSVKDRLAAFYHWGDRQSLEQALLVTKVQTIELENVSTWSAREGKQAEFAVFLRLMDE